MNSIKNVFLNQFLLKEEIKDKESLRLENSPSSYLITYDIYFDRLSADVQEFDLIEGKEIDKTTPFNLYSIRLGQDKNK